MNGSRMSILVRPDFQCKILVLFTMFMLCTWDIVAQRSYSLSYEEARALCGDHTIVRIGSSSPERVVNFDTMITQVGDGVGCSVVLSNGDAYVWSVLRQYVFGDSLEDQWVRVPRRVPLEEDIVDIIAHHEHVIMLTATGDVYAMGLNENRGILGHDTIAYVFEPQKIQLPLPAIQLRYNNSLVAVLLDDGTVWTWGNNIIGAAGRGEGPPFLEPGKVFINEPIRSLHLTAGNDIGYTTFAVTASGKLWVWGSNAGGKAGLGDKLSRSIPTKVDIPGQVKDVVSGNDHSIVLLTDGTIWVSGSNKLGQLGIPSIKDTTRFVNVEGIVSVKQVYAVNELSVVVDSNDSWLAWGSDVRGIFLGADAGRHMTPTTIRKPCSVLSGINVIPQNDIRVWPNPADDEVRIRLSETIGNEVKVRLLSVHGLVEFEARTSVIHAEYYSDVVVRTSTISAGLYFAEIVDEFGRRWFDRVVILR